MWKAVLCFLAMTSSSFCSWNGIWLCRWRWSTGFMQFSLLETVRKVITIILSSRTCFTFSKFSRMGLAFWCSLVTILIYLVYWGGKALVCAWWETLMKVVFIRNPSTTHPISIWLSWGTTWYCANASILRCWAYEQSLWRLFNCPLTKKYTSCICLDWTSLCPLSLTSYLFHWWLMDTWCNVFIRFLVRRSLGFCFCWSVLCWSSHKTN